MNQEASLSREAALVTLQSVGQMLTSEWYRRNNQNREDPNLDQLQARFNSGLLAGINIACHMVRVLEQNIGGKDEERTGQSTV